MPLAIVPRPEPDANLIRASQEFADRCKRGEIVSFCIAAEITDRSITTQYSLPNGGDICRLLGALAYLSRQLIDRCEGD